MKEQGITSFRVRYGETDCMGRVYHANYLSFFECGRVELMRGWGFDYARVEKEEECFLPVVEARIKYRAPAFFDDVIEVRTRVVDHSVVRITFAYDAVRMPSGIVCASGETVLAAVDRAGEPRRLPADLRAFLETIPLPPERERRRAGRGDRASGSIGSIGTSTSQSAGKGGASLGVQGGSES